MVTTHETEGIGLNLELGTEEFSPERVEMFCGLSEERDGVKKRVMVTKVFEGGGRLVFTFSMVFTFSTFGIYIGTIFHFIFHLVLCCRKPRFP